jgi:hypothetical protein
MYQSIVYFNPAFNKIQEFRPRHSSGCYSPASHRDGPNSSPGQVTWDLWWTKWHLGRFSPSTSVSPANSHSTDCSTFIIIIIVYHPGLVQQAN